MLERRSALAAATPYRSRRLTIAEARGFALAQAAGLSPDFEAKLSAIAGPLPAAVGTSVAAGDRTVFRVGPQQFWFVGPEGDDPTPRIASFCAAASLSHGRTRIVLDGAPARDVLAKGIALDFHPHSFRPAMFAMTGLHHTPVLVHCTAADRFEIFALRTFAMSVWEWLTDAALEFAD